jgi:cysteine-rich repeat protein
MRVKLLSIIGLMVGAVLFSGCGEEAGTLGGECYGNATCNTGLVCQAGLCGAAQVEEDIVEDVVDNLDATGDTSGSCAEKADGFGCDDGDPCTLTDLCAQGACVGSSVDPCVSDNPCQQGTCIAFEGCSFEDVEVGVECSTPCFGSSVCVEGTCVPDTATIVACSKPSDESGCVADLLCNPATGLCSSEVYKDEGSACDTDGNLCGLEECDSFGECVETGKINDCAESAAGDPCSFYTCNTKTGTCGASGFLGNISCDDENGCTFNDTCQLDAFNFASCVGTPFPTDDGNACTDDACLDGVVTHTNVDGTTCDPNEPCSLTGLCTEGVCVPATPCECTKNSDCPQSDDQCVGKHICNLDTGTCELDPSTVVECAPSELACHVNECLPGFGSCIELTSPNGTPCNDGNACTAFDTCEGGACIGSQLLECDDGSFCNGTETCDPVTGCNPGVSPIVDDGVGCTSDSCDEVNDTVVHAIDSLLCDDGEFCNGQEVCDPVQDCKIPDVPFVDDGIACTVDVCDGVNEVVSHTPDHAMCDSANACMVDTCDVGTGCQSDPIPQCCGNLLIEVNEECDDGNDVDFDGCSKQCTDECLYTSDGTVAAEHKLSATQGDFLGSLGDGDLFGWAVANPGDIDDDGVEDLVVGIRLDDDGGTATGAVWIVFMNSDGTTKHQQKISKTKGGFDGDLDSSDNFGSSVAALGDMNGDGVEDIAVGAMDDDDGGPARGALWILFLQSDGTVKGHQKISATEGLFGGELDDSDAFGRSVAALGDLDGDGVTDLAVGAYGDDDGGQDAGAMWILFLTAEGKVKHEQKISDQEGGLASTLAKQDLFGSSVAALGDIDGDLLPDVAVGAPYDDAGGFDRGAIYLLMLDETGKVKAHTKITAGLGGFEGALTDDEYFGDAIASIGDWNADGVRDLAVGAPGTDDNGADKGAVWILSLGPDQKVIGEQKIGIISGGLSVVLDDYDFFGAALGSYGLTDGTAPPRLLVGAWGDDDGGEDKGATYLLDLSKICSVCGNQVVEPWEECDDGNLTDNDGCSSECSL